MEEKHHARKNPFRPDRRLGYRFDQVACLIARAEAGRELEIVGVGHQSSQGVRAGPWSIWTRWNDPFAPPSSPAGKMAGENIKTVTVNVTGGYPPVSSDRL